MASKGTQTESAAVDIEVMSTSQEEPCRQDTCQRKDRGIQQPQFKSMEKRMTRYMQQERQGDSMPSMPKYGEP